MDTHRLSSKLFICVSHFSLLAKMGLITSVLTLNILIQLTYGRQTLYTKKDSVSCSLVETTSVRSKYSYKTVCGIRCNQHAGMCVGFRIEQPTCKFCMVCPEIATMSQNSSQSMFFISKHKELAKGKLCYL